MKLNNHSTIIISRTDKIGDVVLTLPLAGYLKQKFPECTIYFLGRTYTKSIVENYQWVDYFINADEIVRGSKKEQQEKLKFIGAEAIIHVFPNKEIARIAKSAKIPLRVGTSHRKFHWLTCNRWVNFSRKRSMLHEAQLNFQLLSGVGIQYVPSIDELKTYFGESNFKPSKFTEKWIPMKDKMNVIIHPGSRGSAREWGHDNFTELVSMLQSNEFVVWISGSEEEGREIRPLLDEKSLKYNDISGRLTLDEFIAFIGQSQVLVAASTGPLHIAAAKGIWALGIYPPMKPIHPGRWAPIGNHTKVFVKNTQCNKCRKTKNCECMRSIKAESIASFIHQIFLNESTDSKS